MKRFDVNDLVFSKPKKNILGGQTVVIKFDKQKPTLTLKKLSCVKINLQNSITYTSETHDDLSFFDQMDKVTMNMAFAHAFEWFGKDVSIDTIKSLFVPSVREHELKTKLSSELEFFNICNHKIDFHEIISRNIDVVIEIAGVYFIPGKFGIAYKTKQIKILPKYNLFSYSFIDDNDSDFSDAEPN